MTDTAHDLLVASLFHWRLLEEDLAYRLAETEINMGERGWEGKDRKATAWFSLLDGDGGGSRSGVGDCVDTGSSG